MSSIRRQSIISSIIVYFGFALGMFNTYLFTRQGGLTKEEFGLTGLFIAFANIMFSVASLGMPSYISKFFPYYKAHVPDQKNDQISWALLFPCLGFLAVLLAGLVFKSILVDKIFNNSPQLLQYYYWTFPFGFGYTLFMVLEAYAWQQRRSAMSNLLREVVFRFMVTVLIVLVTLHYIRNFETFIAIYAFSYLALVIFMLVYFYRRGQLHFTFTKSQVTKRFYAKILTLVGFVWGGSLVFNIASVFDTIVIAAVIPNGVAAVGIFTVAQNLSSLMQAPQRAVISAAVGPISQAWRNKDYKKIRTIYQRSSINQLIFASAMFCLIWLNFSDGLQTFHIQGDFQAAKWVFFYLAMTRIVDMGTGLNSQIIGNSTYWRFEFVSGLILLALMLPLNWQLTRYMGLLGPAISNLIAFTIYNLIRFLFLYRKFHMQPFNWKTLQAILLAAVAYGIAWLVGKDGTGILYIMLRSAVFCLLFGAGMIQLKLSPDAIPVWKTVLKRLRLDRG
jgi:O-antigen/teichoic acid export membrane protein